MKIVVITAVLSIDQKELESTYRSLRPLLNRNFIWLIKLDGNNLLNSLGHILEDKYVSIINKPDTGLYSALNQALFSITGGYFFVLGAGDRVRAEQFHRVLNQSTLESPQIIFAGIFHELRKKSWLPNPEALKNSMSCPHPSTLFSTNLAQELGGFDERYRVAADYDLVSRAVKQKASTMTVDEIIIDFKGGGISERTLEGPLECELIKWRIWGTPISWGPRKT